MTEYDPNFHGVTGRPRGKYDTVLATYVLNVLPRTREPALLREIRGYLRASGEGYATVRSDLDAAGATSRGFQRPVHLRAPVEGRVSGGIIYRLEPG